MTNLGLPRCGWATSDPLYIAYHDEEWGRPVRDDRHLFEIPTLERRRRGCRGSPSSSAARGIGGRSRGFDVERIARYGEKDVERLMASPAWWMPTS